MSEGVPLARIEVNTTDDPECGIAIALFVAGCPRRCVACQNPDLWDVSGFEVRPILVIQDELERFFVEAEKLVDSVVFVGGDWSMYPVPYVELAEWVQSRGLRTVLYTGETYEMLPESVRKVTDWVIDGIWMRDKPGIYPPSTNQRVFHKGELVDPAELPLYQHLASRAGK